MIAQSSTLVADLQAIVGTGHVLPAAPTFTIAGVQPQLIIEPGTVDEAAHVLRYANHAGLRIAPRGGGTKLTWGNSPRGADLVLSTRRLDRVLEHAWGDMTTTVEAGCTVAELQRTLAEHGQRLALDPLWPEQATIGGILAANDSGALRLRFGSLRDLIIGITVVLADGTIARSGGKVVKNVAGYDLPKLMTGALGTLGLIVEAVFRLYPLPSATRTVSLRLPSVQAANTLVLKMLDSTMVPVAAQLAEVEQGKPRLDVWFEGVEAAMDTQIAQLHQISRDNQVSLSAVDDAPPTREALWHNLETSLVCKLSVLSSQITDSVHSIQRIAGPLQLSWRMVMQAVGVGLLRIDGANDQVLLAAFNLLRAAIAEQGGSLVLLHSPPSVLERSDAWGAHDAALALQRRVKDYFDPQAILNPGRFVGGI